MTLFDETRQGQQDEATVQNATTSITLNLNTDRGKRQEPVGKLVRSVRRRLLKARFPYGLVLPVLIIAFWELASLVGWTDPTTLPTPTAVISTLVGLILDGTPGPRRDCCHPRRYSSFLPGFFSVSPGQIERMGHGDLEENRGSA